MLANECLGCACWMFGQESANLSGLYFQLCGLLRFALSLAFGLLLGFAFGWRVQFDVPYTPAEIGRLALANVKPTVYAKASRAPANKPEPMPAYFAVPFAPSIQQQPETRPFGKAAAGDFLESRASIGC